MPKPEVKEPLHNLDVTVGSTAVFTCDFKASTDNKITKIHWEFNNTDLAECRRLKNKINCTVTQYSSDTNYISSSLTIHSVQPNNVGNYTCYCSYNTSVLNVNGVQVIQSEHKSAVLSIQSGNEIITVEIVVYIYLKLNSYRS